MVKLGAKVFFICLINAKSEVRQAKFIKILNIVGVVAHEPKLLVLSSFDDIIRDFITGKVSLSSFIGPVPTLNFFFFDYFT